MACQADIGILSEGPTAIKIRMLNIAVMDTGISILIYITYAYLYCLQLLLDSAFTGLDHFMIIE
jgi:hypothetical protein